MIKPPPDLATVIAALAPASGRVPALLHVTLIPLGDRMSLPAQAIDAAIMIGEAVRGEPFRLIFDLLTGGAKLVLRGSERMRGAVRFQSLLVETIRRHHWPMKAYRFAPHITLDYRGAAGGTMAVDPISWLAEEFLLIESIVGEGRHVEHGRWRLR